MQNMITVKQSNKHQDILLLLGKIIYLLFLLYYGWFQMMFFNIPRMSSILGASTIFFILLHALANNVNILKSITIEVFVWTIFASFSLFTGLLVAKNLGYLMNSIFVFIQYIIMIIGMTYISLQDKKMNYFINSYILFAIVCAITTIYYGFSYSTTRATMSESTNPNTIGLIMVYGVFCILYYFDLRKLSHGLFQFSTIALFLYTIILTGARKHILSVFILMIFWFIFVRKDVFKAINKNKRIKSILFYLLLLISLYVIINMFIESGAFVRLQRLSDAISGVRKDMYLVAFELFKENPFFGVGFNNYRAVSGFQTYSHSTYAEALSCTGLIGALLYFLPYITISYKIIKIRKTNNLITKKNTNLVASLFIVLMFLGTSVIHFYSVYSSIAFGFIIIYCRLHIRKDALNQKDMVFE
jgi:O-antigen ligase